MWERGKREKEKELLSFSMWATTLGGGGEKKLETG